MRRQKQDLSKAKDLFEEYAETIKENPKKMKEFENAVIDVYEQTGDTYILLAALRVIASKGGQNAGSNSRKNQTSG